MNLNTLETISLCLTTILTNFLVFLFFVKVYQMKIKTKYMLVIIWIIATSIHLLYNRTVKHFSLPQVLNSIYFVVHVNFLSIVLCKDKLKRKILFNIVYVLIMIISEVLSAMIWTVIEGISMQNVLTSSKYTILSCVFNAFLTFLLCNICIYVLSRKELTKIRTKQILSLILLTVFEIFVVYIYTINISSYLDGIIAMIMLAGFISLNFAITYIMELIAKFYEDKMELHLVRKQNELQLANYTEMSKKQKESEKVIHDIKKHLYTLSELSTIDTAKAENYRKLIEKGMDSLVIGFHCTNQILSIIMSQKIAAAENENIKVKIDVQDLTLEFISDIDITAIFANLWDNAIEACMQVDEDKRYIGFLMKQSGGFVVISVHNSHSNKVDSSDGEYFSTKENHKGVGLSIIKSAVEKYNGLFNIEHDENTFTAEITIPVPVK